MEWFVNCAKNYILHGQSIEDMCEHNAEVSQNNDRFKVQLIMLKNGIKGQKKRRKKGITVMNE